MEFITPIIAILALIAFFVAVTRLGTIAAQTKKTAAILHIAFEAELIAFMEKQDALIREAESAGNTKRANELRAAKIKLNQTLYPR